MDPKARAPTPYNIRSRRLGANNNNFLLPHIMCREKAKHNIPIFSSSTRLVSTLESRGERGEMAGSDSAQKSFQGLPLKPQGTRPRGPFLANKTAGFVLLRRQHSYDRRTIGKLPNMQNFLPANFPGKLV